MNGRVIAALVLRYSLLYLRSWIRSIELIFWPTFELLLWGFLSVFIQGQTEGDFPYFAKFLIGAMIFWDVLFRAQQGVAISFLEDVWTRNLLNLFVAPIRLSEVPVGNLHYRVSSSHCYGGFAGAFRPSTLRFQSL